MGDPNPDSRPTTTTPPETKRSSLLAEKIDSHETSLHTHLTLVQSFADTVRKEDAEMASRVLEGAQKLMEGFARLREQLKFPASTEPQSASDRKRKIHPISQLQDGSKSKARRTGSNLEKVPTSATATASASHRPGESRDRRPGQKRRRADASDEDANTNTETEAGRETAGKRTRTKRAIPGADVAVSDYIPVALQRDDISAEVDRRLRLRDELRGGRRDRPLAKRKRDSTGSFPVEDAVAAKPNEEGSKRLRQQ